MNYKIISLLATKRNHHCSSFHQSHDYFYSPSVQKVKRSKLGHLPKTNSRGHSNSQYLLFQNTSKLWPEVYLLTKPWVETLKLLFSNLFIQCFVESGNWKGLRITVLCQSIWCCDSQLQWERLSHQQLFCPHNDQ